MVNKVIIVGRGFTKAARLRATALRFQLQTVESLEACSASMFDGPPPDLPADFKPEVRKEPLSWWIVDVTGNPIQVEQRPEDRLVHRRTGIEAVPSEFVDRLIPGVRRNLGEARLENRGCNVAVVFNLTVSNYLLRCSAGEITLGTIVITSGKSMVLPKMTARAVRVVTDEVGSHEVIVRALKVSFHILRSRMSDRLKERPPIR